MKDILAIMFAQTFVLTAAVSYTKGLNDNGKMLLAVSTWYLISWFLHWVFTGTKT
jgi:membrane protease YdiL (CAAX protease family)